MRPPAAPVHTASTASTPAGPRRLSPRAAVVLGLAGVLAAAAVIGASHAAAAPAGPTVEASAPPRAASVER